jgi:hypothetical protein
MTTLDKYPETSSDLDGLKNGKDAKTGRFVKGHPGGPGRPRKEVERAYLDELRRLVPLSEWGKVVARALEDAKKGDARARDWLSKYLVGDDPLLMLEVLDRLAELEGR